MPKPKAKETVKKHSVQFAQDTRLAMTNGHIKLFQAGVPKQVDEKTYRQAIAQGGIDGKIKLTLDDMDGEEATNETDPDSEDGIGNVEGTGTETPVLGIARVMRDIIDEGDADNLTDGGRPKAVEVNRRFGSDTSKEQREAAYNMIEEGTV